MSYIEHGSGVPAVVLHGAGVDHREAEACFDPILERYGGIRRIYPDLPGTGRSPAPGTLRSADGVLDVLLGFVVAVTDERPVLVLGHSAGGYYARAVAARRPTRVAGLALVCPLLAETGVVPPHRPVVATGGLGDDGFRSYFVVQTPEMLDRYERYVVPGLELVDRAAMGRIGEHWELSSPGREAAYPGPALLVAGRRDSTVGYAATAALLEHYPAATLAVLDAAGHALPHEQPALLASLVTDWLDRCDPTG